MAQNGFKMPLQRLLIVQNGSKWPKMPLQCHYNNFYQQASAIMVFFQLFLAWEMIIIYR